MKHEVLEKSQCTTVCCKILSFTQYVICFLLLSSCGLNKTSKNNVLNANLHEEPVSAKELFSKISVIPLETNDSSLLVRPNKILLHNNEYYIFDKEVPATFVFNEQGEFLRKIGMKGQGPGEFSDYIYDAAISRYSNTIYMISPSGKIYCFDLMGKFIKEIILPTKSNYQAVEEYNKDLLVLWTLPCGIEEPAVSIVSKTTMREIKNYWHVNRILCGLTAKPLYLYNGDIYFSTPFERKVYHIGLDSLQNVYSWDFGKDDIDIKKYLTLDESRKNEENDLMFKYLQNSTIPFYTGQQYQNKYFYFCEINYHGEKKDKSLFYRKRDGRTFFFQKTTEGIILRPIYFDDDCLMCIVYNEEFSAYKNVLPKEEYQKLEQRSDDDNPCLVKFNF